MHLPISISLFEMLACAGFGLAIAWISIRVILSLSERPRVRGGEFHHEPGAPVPRLGGLALVTAFTSLILVLTVFGSLSTVSSALLATIGLGSLTMFALGMWDDLRGLSARFKLMSQVLIAAGVYAGGIRIEVLRNPITGVDEALGLLGLLATVFWLVTLTNLINLIDGMDGLAGGICLMLMILLAHLGVGGASGFPMLLSLGMAGALVAFLRFNYPPARIYMGDSGAYFLGFLIGTLSIVNSNKGTVLAALLAPAFALALPIADASLTVLRRGLRGLPVFRPDRRHIHHQLLSLGFSRERAVLFLYTVSSVCLFLAFDVFWMQGRFLPLFAGVLLLVLAVAGHLSGFTREWSTMGELLGKSPALRRESRYALALAQCLEMEAERCRSFDELWRLYQQFIAKLGFSEIHLVFADGTRVSWRAPEIDNEHSGNLQRTCHAMGDGSSIEFSHDPIIHGDLVFNLLVDLATEAWHRATSRWQNLDRKARPAGSGRGLPELTLLNAAGRFHPRGIL